MQDSVHARSLSKIGSFGNVSEHFPHKLRCTRDNIDDAFSSFENLIGNVQKVMNGVT